MFYCHLFICFATFATSRCYPKDFCAFVNAKCQLFNNNNNCISLHKSCCNGAALILKYTRYVCVRVVMYFLHDILVPLHSAFCPLLSYYLFHPLHVHFLVFFFLYAKWFTIVNECIFNCLGCKCPGCPLYRVTLQESANVCACMCKYVCMYVCVGMCLWKYVDRIVNANKIIC